MPAPAQNQPENPSGAQGVPVGTARGASKAVPNGRSRNGNIEADRALIDETAINLRRTPGTAQRRRDAY
jgi:hypothetical protein